MFSSLASLVNRFRLGRASKPTSRKRRPANRHRVCLQVEALEQRDVPTVDFLSNWGYETIHGSVTDGMQNPPVVLVFSGNYWTTTTAGEQDMATLKNSAAAIMSGPYLTGLTEYGSDGKATFAQCLSIPDTVTIDKPGPKGQADDVKLNSLLDNAINNEGALKPGNTDWQHAPIYVVISDPSSSQGSTVGHNSMGHYPQTGGDNIHMIWMSTSTGSDGHVKKDQWTDQFGHELVETLSDPDSNGVTITPPANLPQSLQASGPLQIGDDEPDNMAYTWTLDGNVVQAYWSARNDAFIVPDGNTQTLTLTANWNSTDTYVNNFNLFVYGNQRGFTNNTITLDNSGGNVSVTLNQESFVCAPNSISTIYVYTAGGANKVQVNALPASVASLKLSGGQGTDAITIGNGTLAGISQNTAIDVTNTLGQSSVFISGYQGAPANVVIDGGTIRYNQVTITCETSTVLGQKCGVTSIGIDTPNGSSINAEAVDPLMTVTVYVGPSDPVVGPAVNQLTVVRRFQIYFPPPPVTATLTVTNTLNL
jgi:hypothetical protein